MYLYATKFVSGYDFNEQEKTENISVLKALGVDRDDIPNHVHPSIFARVAVGYWRKSNAIHAWFVDNVQDGKDECQYSDVSRKDLGELVDLCRKVLNNKEEAPKLMATRSGFFFGSTSYDEYFFKDLEDTIVMIEKILSNKKFESWDFEYHSSW